MVSFWGRMFFISFFAFPLILGIVAWLIRKRSRSTCLDSGEQINSNSLSQQRIKFPIGSIVIIMFFPLFLCLYQFSIGSEKNLFIFVPAYLLIAIAISVIVVLSFGVVSRHSLQTPGQKLIVKALAVIALLSASLYVAWMSAAITSGMRMWSANVLGGNVLEGMLGIAVATILVFLVRTITPYAKSHAFYPLLMLSCIGLFFWIYLNVKINEMPFLFAIFKIMDSPVGYAMNSGEVTIRQFYLLQGLLCQFLAPVILISFAIMMRPTRRSSVTPSEKSTIC